MLRSKTFWVLPISHGRSISLVSGSGVQVVSNQFYLSAIKTHPIGVNMIFQSSLRLIWLELDVRLSKNSINLPVSGNCVKSTYTSGTNWPDPTTIFDRSTNEIDLPQIVQEKSIQWQWKKWLFDFHVKLWTGRITGLLLLGSTNSTPLIGSQIFCNSADPFEQKLGCQIEFECQIRFVRCLIWTGCKVNWKSAFNSWEGSDF